LYFRAFDRDD